ncbi:Mitochondrial carrier protein-like protein [Venustampulla echinocandica]|uniref:Mitochondrial carrier protein-like protein n=1 Tax=Venustampulla echinocandica TaxID=2656787 RepID=A0A370TI53_9HELO|nr:Mitochondrial carrier protein-like protein [Venustampulla echinocandica]RDL35025.1 Mitochondrial carrier protein-like protein [Venustampulla echinocandica]
MNDNHARISPALVETIAGLSAGTISTLAVHPLDVIKTRLQIQRKSTTPLGGYSIGKSLLASQRPIQTLYRGLTPNLVGNASSWAIFFYFKSIIEKQLLIFHGQPGTSPTSQHDSAANRNALTPFDYFLASGISGTITTFATNPIWVVKTRMLSSDRGSKGAYESFWHGIQQLWVREGLKGFYRGVGVTLLGNSHGAVQFAVYEPMKNTWKKYLAQQRELSDGIMVKDQKDEKLGNTATLILSGSAKVVAGTVTYPYQVFRSRIQTYHADETFGKGITGVAKKVLREEGWRGFYRGLGTNIVRVLPATWVTFLVYENVRYYLPSWANSI